MSSYFRPRILVNPLNLPQLPSGNYRLASVAAVNKGLNLDPAAITMSLGTTNIFDAQYTTGPTFSLDSAAITMSVNAHN